MGSNLFKKSLFLPLWIFLPLLTFLDQQFSLLTFVDLMFFLFFFFSTKHISKLLWISVLSCLQNATKLKCNKYGCMNVKCSSLSFPIFLFCHRTLTVIFSGFRETCTIIYSKWPQKCVFCRWNKPEARCSVSTNCITLGGTGFRNQRHLNEVQTGQNRLLQSILCGKIYYYMQLPEIENSVQQLVVQWLYIT